MQFNTVLSSDMVFVQIGLCNNCHKVKSRIKGGGGGGGRRSKLEGHKVKSKKR